MTDSRRERRAQPLVSRARIEPAPRPVAEREVTATPVVLVVDDEPDVREWLRLSLSLGGWSVEEAATGDEAIEAWQRIVPDVVLLDQRLDGMSGFDCAAKLRELSSDTRIIMVSGHLDAEATREARQLRILPIEKADHERLFQLLDLLAEQIRTAKTSFA